MNNKQREEAIHHLSLAELELGSAWSCLFETSDYRLTDPRPKISKMINELVGIRVQVRNLETSDEFRQKFEARQKEKHDTNNT